MLIIVVVVVVINKQNANQRGKVYERRLSERRISVPEDSPSKQYVSSSARPAGPGVRVATHTGVG